MYSYNLNICSCMFECIYLAAFQQTYFILRHISSIQFLRGQMLFLLISQWSSRATADHAEAPVATPAKTQLLGGATVSGLYPGGFLLAMRGNSEVETNQNLDDHKSRMADIQPSDKFGKLPVNMLMKLCNRGFSWFSNRKANEPKVGSGSQFFHPTWGEE